VDKTTLGMSKVLKKELRKEHFKVGNFGDQFNSMSNSHF
jgi:hypothetical protein